MREQDLFDKLRKIECLYAGATTHGEKEAAAEAIARIKRRLGEAAKVDHPIEYKFTLVDGWSRKLFIALLRRYSLKPYRRAVLWKRPCGLNSSNSATCCRPISTK
jgi:ferric iron reductase protein FhuF